MEDVAIPPTSCKEDNNGNIFSEEDNNGKKKKKKMQNKNVCVKLPQTPCAWPLLQRAGCIIP